MPRMSQFEADEHQRKWIAKRIKSAWACCPGTDAGCTKHNQREVGKGGIQDDIEQWLKSLGHICYWVRSRTDKPSTNAVGTPDFVGIINGRGFGIEVKQRGRKQTREQAGELLRVQLAGGMSTVVHSLAEAQAFFGFYQKEIKS